ncbi:preprotein translocase subunit SecG [Paenibacillus sp. MAHUQ-46]|uniref:Protein-export membrane protein SecG n=1 Tax=Paenibacillus roseus TaxID=2798579 RepID=A0A934J5K2_9BACL|nr:preprotein translocase subunit SecG [Paenibacillus roseus]
MAWVSFIAPEAGGGTVVALKIILVIFSLGLIAAVLLQKGKSAGLSGAISGGAEHLFGKQKARGLDLFLQRLTVVLAVGFFLLSLTVAYLVKSS